MPADPTLDLVKQVAQLHEDDQAGHGQPDVAKQLNKGKENKTLNKINVNSLVR